MELGFSSRFWHGITCCGRSPSNDRAAEQCLGTQAPSCQWKSWCYVLKLRCVTGGTDTRVQRAARSVALAALICNTLIVVILLIN
jgi:hypothetical protein